MRTKLNLPQVADAAWELIQAEGVPTFLVMAISDAIDEAARLNGLKVWKMNGEHLALDLDVAAELFSRTMHEPFRVLDYPANSGFSESFSNLFEVVPLDDINLDSAKTQEGGEEWPNTIG